MNQLKLSPKSLSCLIPRFFSVSFFPVIRHVARYALLSGKETITKTLLGLKSQKV